MKSRYLGPTFLFFLSILVLSQCRIDDELYRLKKTTWAPEVVVPLAHARVSVNDVFARNRPEVISIDDDQIITLKYQAVLDSKSGAELLKLLDRTFEVLSGVNKYGLPLHANSIFKSAQFSAGELQLELEQNGSSSIGRIELHIPSLKIDGQDFVLSTVDASEIDEDIDLTNAELNFEGGLASEIEIEFQVFDPNEIDITDEFTMYLSLKNLIIKKAKGWFDQLLLNFDTDTIEIDVFKNWKSGSVFLDDPRIKFSITNSIGIPFSASISTMDASDGFGSTVIPISYSGPLGEEFAIEYPSADELEEYINSIYILDKKNSNLANVIEISPKELHYGFNFVTKHDYNLDEAGYISDTSKITISTALELPFTGRIQDIRVMDTVGISTSFTNELENVESATLELRTTNALPIGMELQLYMLNANGEVLDSVLASPKFLAAPAIGATGYVAASIEESNSVHISKERLSRLNETRSIAILGRLESSNGGQNTVSFQSTNFLGVDLGLKLKYSLL